MGTEATRFDGVHCQMNVEAPRYGVVVLRITGRDVGEFGARPIQEIEQRLHGQKAASLFVDARATTGASIDVSNQWAQWLLNNRARLNRVHMLVGSQFVRMTAEFVRRFASLNAIMTIHSDARDFDRALAEVLG